MTIFNSGILGSSVFPFTLFYLLPVKNNFNYFADGKDEHRKGLLQMKMAEGAKLQMCYLLHHLCDIQLRHRVESIINFSYDYIADLQSVSNLI